ncbi:hypothetical protein RB7298 [Rhodopirellula baltica SH 1]|uniref:Uncharacterized protein n=1 Tax=Rhodopirellula baltica (strain DSM 10527 / NCIMB 13988 / SH1) TaxID=243090 RepID=Q7UNW9_RHOBA|nr:hypothetical protein RB7298 [Rhodopirellula baltica SH 1]
MASFKGFLSGSCELLKLGHRTRHRMHPMRVQRQCLSLTE